MARERGARLHYLCRVDMEAIARAQRRRQALEALEFERQREAALHGQLEEVIAELAGDRIDEDAFARMAADEVELVRAALADSRARDLAFREELAAGWLPEDEQEDAEEEQRERLAEVARLQEEIAACRRRQQAFVSYLRALSQPPSP